MFNKYSYSWLLFNFSQSKIEHSLGTQQAINSYDAEERLRDKIEKEFPSSDGWELKSLLVDEDEIEYVANLT